MRKVLVFGTFDLFHEGHRDFLRQAAAFGDTLAVIVARDGNTGSLKGRTPMDDEQTRLANVQSDPHVTEARLGYENREHVYDVLDDVKPEVICLGYDQRGFAGRLPQELLWRGMVIPVIRLKAYEPQRFKSSVLRPADCYVGS